MIAVAVILLEVIAIKLRGGRMGRNVVVRCQKSHLFTTIWIPGASLKSVRLGWLSANTCMRGLARSGVSIRYTPGGK
jgi:hypothetical protein